MTRRSVRHGSSIASPLADAERKETMFCSMLNHFGLKDVTMNLDRTKRYLPIAFLLTSAVAYACQVPVFRYALERWHADSYRFVVISEGPLTETQKSALAPFEKMRPQSTTTPARLDLTVLEEQQIQDPALRRLWDARPIPSQPLLAAFYPLGSDAPADRPAFMAALSPQSVQESLTSPVRQRVEQLLGQGNSAVWIFVESGHAERDQQAYQVLEKQLRLDEAWLELPSAAELEIEPQVLAQAKIKLQIKFSIVKLSRDDQAEQFLLQTLLNSEADLKSFDEPMAFPVFGRGRVLYALIGKGIAVDTIRSASAFMAGPCSCQVKNQNPGFDLLMTCDWDQAVGKILISDPIESPPSDAEPSLLKIPPGRGPSAEKH